MTIEAVAHTTWIPLGTTEGHSGLVLDAICTLTASREVLPSRKIAIDVFQEIVTTDSLDPSDLVEVLITQGDS